ncbi:MAG: SRPBCC family protein [Myxococcota bacterium]
MKVLKVAGVVVAVLLVAFFGIAWMLPDARHVERSILIEAEPETIYDLVDSFDRFNEFSPWYARDPGMKQTLEGPADGVGHRMTWESDKDDVGNGSQEIVAVSPPNRVETELDFGFGEPPHATFLIEPRDSGSRVTWALDSTFHNDLIGRYFGLKLDDWVGPDYERGLERLKAVAEADQREKARVDDDVAALENGADTPTNAGGVTGTEVIGDVDEVKDSESPADMP